MKASPLKFTPAMDAYLREIYPHFSNKAITLLTGWNETHLRHNAERLCLKKTPEARRKSGNPTDWTPAMVKFVQDNFYSTTNQWLADQLGLTLTVVRNKTRQLGLQHFPMKYWTEEQAQFLKDNYQSIGDTEIAEKLQEMYPREDPWTRKHVHKKRCYLKLYRTQQEIKSIVAEHSKPGGRSHTILKNSGVVNLNDRYIANFISKDPDIKDELMKHPEIIDLKRQQILLNRTLKGTGNGK